MIDGGLEVFRAFGRSGSFPFTFLCIDYGAAWLNTSGNDISTWSGWFVPVTRLDEPLPASFKPGNYILSHNSGPMKGGPYKLALTEGGPLKAGASTSATGIWCSSFGEVDVDNALANFGRFSGGTKNVNPVFVLDSVTFADGSTREFDNLWIFEMPTTADLGAAWRSLFYSD